MSEPIVIGHPDETVSGIFIMGGTQTGGSGSGGGTNVAPLIAQNQAAAEASVEIDNDASDDEIVLIGRKIKGTILSALNQLNARMGYQVTLPCLPAQSGNKIRAMVGSLKFKITSTNYGTNRAGANLARSSTSSIPVEINKDALKIYSTYDGGILYLILHEVAHTFKEMRDFNKSQYASWRANGGGAGLSGQELKDAYSKSAEFELNEARTNTIARGLAGLFNNMGGINFNPRYGYATC